MISIKIDSSKIPSNSKLETLKDPELRAACEKVYNSVLELQKISDEKDLNFMGSIVVTSDIDDTIKAPEDTKTSWSMYSVHAKSEPLLMFILMVLEYGVASILANVHSSVRDLLKSVLVTNVLQSIERASNRADENENNSEK